jgi:hypothetical protein
MGKERRKEGRKGVLLGKGCAGDKWAFPQCSSITAGIEDPDTASQTRCGNRLYSMKEILPEFFFGG